MRENMIEADQIYAGKWCGSVLLSKISEDLSGTGEDKSRSHEGKQCILILPRLRITRHYLVERG
jgi:hypothetical protein